MDRDSRSRRYDDGEVTRYGAESEETPVIAGDETIDPDETLPLAVPLRDEVLSAVVRRADSPRQDGMTEIEILEIIGIEVACDPRGEALIQGPDLDPLTGSVTVVPEVPLGPHLPLFNEPARTEVVHVVQNDEMIAMTATQTWPRIKRSAEPSRYLECTDPLPDYGPPRGIDESRCVPSTPVSHSQQQQQQLSSSSSKPFDPPKGPAADKNKQQQQQPPQPPSFAQQLLASMPPLLLPGGKIDPAQLAMDTGVLPELQAHTQRLKEEEERIREEKYVKEERLRRSLAEWDRMERESKVMELRDQLAEQSLKKISGEGTGGAAF
ncbi:putative serine arginine repetitive matrix protein 1 protein [Eutypa lata UCREL1]|uniref:Putative serine arginine repetitive matrix protein 1 protein n=1 Tax=Eutypa lata (strain UCR-EL1) TaxID=1287681 RepID=M7SMK7_EUTLA|nr:putative serine arginine repetitive matrix protein 1 protein [Eutypa lata UCREL1]